MIQLKFNISYSSFSLYKKSPLVFFFNYIAKVKSNKVVNTAYGDLGQIIHTFAELYLVNSKINKETAFNNLWLKYDIDNKLGFDNKHFNKESWFKYILSISSFINKNLSNKLIIAEKLLQFSFCDFKFKGYIDGFFKNKNIINIYDWKTNSKHDFDTHFLQRKFYSWLCYKVYNIIPSCFWFYTKNNDLISQTFTKQEVIAFETELIRIANEIKLKGSDINNYDFGDCFKMKFNNYTDYCEIERDKRNLIKNGEKIFCTINKNRLNFFNLNSHFKQILDIKYSYKVKGCEFSALYQSGRWNGRRSFYKRNSLPYAFVNDFKQLLADYNKRFKKNFVLVIKDLRDKEVMSFKFNTKFKASDKVLRYYQKEAVKVAIKKEVGILNLGCGAGKTFISSQIIRQLDCKTLFLINRKELLEQTAEVFEEELGVVCGKMFEGNLDVNHQVVCGSIQTIVAILKRKNAESRQLIKYLNSIVLLVADESQNCNNAKSYAYISKNTINCKWIIGLSGSPFRN